MLIAWRRDVDSCAQKAPSARNISAPPVTTTAK